ncbi:aspartyl/asparaginyl beta-hydroxylase domain-containing protein [uncultured Sphingomonas sp.]|uniref:aspartyl/asparaginyl beta-hydroxylase domain-containing protein n=1 Tax=uncultured Sphingomonas sp. TaxID=158754 RepID=UPI0025CF4044|nr:aspartyl/asparaginyl beta-hydroxylase domain-containing protein [uncultured Sphingomonas sp.]
MHPAEREADTFAARGDLAGAEPLLEQALAAQPNRAETWLKLGSVRRALGNASGAMAAVSEALRLEPLNFMGLMSRARLKESAGDAVEAARDYLRALAQLPPDQPVSPHLRAMVAHAQRQGEAFRDQVAARWEAVTQAVPGLDPDMRKRAQRFTSNALHRTRVYHSEPTHYHYPGLIEREFHDRSAFPWLTQLEAQTDAIRAEYLAMQQRGAGVGQPYVQYEAGLPVRQWAALNHSLDWTAFHLTQNGGTISVNADACPATMAALAPIDQPQVKGRSPNAMFSLLKPRTRIPAHTGVANTRLVCHLPLIVPDGCWFRVGAETRQWREGEAFVFDDTIEHEAANDSDAPRVVLIFDVWHPGLAPPEREVVARLMEAGGLDEGTPL